jgi:hypothetical protein
MGDRGATAAAIVAPLAVFSPRLIARSRGVRFVQNGEHASCPRVAAPVLWPEGSGRFFVVTTAASLIARSRQSPRRRRRRGRVVRRRSARRAGPRAPRPFVVVTVFADRSLASHQAPLT